MKAKTYSPLFVNSDNVKSKNSEAPYTLTVFACLHAFNSVIESFSNLGQLTVIPFTKSGSCDRGHAPTLVVKNNGMLMMSCG